MPLPPLHATACIAITDCVPYGTSLISFGVTSIAISYFNIILRKSQLPISIPAILSVSAPLSTLTNL
jgi:hypothetical protein